jgi:hypothetical protein
MSSQGTSATEANRPISRGIAKTGSGKKKRSVAGGATAAGAAATAAGGAGGAGAAPEGPQVGAGIMGLTTTDPCWKLRLISTDTTSLIVTKDTEKEDRYKALKDSWEQQQPGRASKAREARDAYTKQVEQGVIRPTSFTIHATKDSCKPWSILNHNNSSAVSTPAVAIKATAAPPNETLSPLSQASISSKRSSSYLSPLEKKEDKDEESLPEEPIAGSQSTVHQGVIVNWPPSTGPRILTKEEIAERDEQRGKTYSQSISYQEKIRQDRVKDKEKRIAVRQHQVAVVDEKLKETELYKSEDVARREAYKLFVLKQIEDAIAKKAQIALAAAGLANAEGAVASDDAGAEKKKKGAGVKAR